MPSPSTLTSAIYNSRSHLERKQTDPNTRRRHKPPATPLIPHHTRDCVNSYCIHHQHVATRSRCGPDRHEATTAVPCFSKSTSSPDAYCSAVRSSGAKAHSSSSSPSTGTTSRPGILFSRNSFGPLGDVLRDTVQVSVQEQVHTYVLAVHDAPGGRHHTPSSAEVTLRHCR